MTPAYFTAKAVIEWSQALQFEVVNGRDYVIFGKDRLEIARLFFNDPVDAGRQIVHLSLQLLASSTSAFHIVTVGDT
ncbi:MAG TPA: hypothetical protein VF598_10670, partial [Hymenobacter sp.]